MFGNEFLQLADDRGSSSAGDLGLHSDGVRRDSVLGERDGIRLHEPKPAKVLQELAPPFRQRGRKLLAGVLEQAGGLDDVAAAPDTDVAVILATAARFASSTRVTL